MVPVPRFATHYGTEKTLRDRSKCSGRMKELRDGKISPRTAGYYSIDQKSALFKFKFSMEKKKSLIRVKRQNKKLFIIS